MAIKLIIYSNLSRTHIAVGCHDEPLKSLNLSTLSSVQDKDLLMPLPPKVSRSKFMLPPPAKKSKSFHHIPPKEKPKDPHLAQLDKEGVLKIESIKFFICKDEDPDEVYTCCECKMDILKPNHFS